MTEFALTKTCSKCGADKPVDQFNRRKSSKDGLAGQCKLCKKEYQKSYYSENKATLNERSRKNYADNRDRYLAQNRIRYAENRDKYRASSQRWMEENREKMLDYYKDRSDETRRRVAELKQDPCLDCGKEYPSEVMEFDHVRGEKRFRVGAMRLHKWERVLEEIGKCELVCCGCHRIRSHFRRKDPKTPRLLKFRRWINEKKNRPCTDCGEIWAPEAMDFDHVRGEKVSEITNMWSWSRKRVESELEKCEIVCANCHRVRTVERMDT